MLLQINNTSIIKAPLGVVVRVLDCQSKGSGFKSRPLIPLYKFVSTNYKFGSRFLLHFCPLTNLAMMSKSNQYSFNWQITTTDTDAKVVYIIPMLLDERRTK